MHLRIGPHGVLPIQQLFQITPRLQVDLRCLTTAAAATTPAVTASASTKAAAPVPAVAASARLPTVAMTTLLTVAVTTS